MLHPKSQERIRVEERLRQGSPGQYIGAPEMESIVGKPCSDSRDEGWLIVARCIKTIEKDHNLFWQWNRKAKHWKCLTDEEKPDVMDWRLDKVKRNAKRVVRMGESIDYTEIPAEQRPKATAKLVIALAVSRLSSPFTRKRVETIDHQKPDENVLLEAFRRRLPK